MPLSKILSWLLSRPAPVPSPASEYPLPERNDPLIADSPAPSMPEKPADASPETTEDPAAIPASAPPEADSASNPPADSQAAADLPPETCGSAPDAQAGPTGAPAEPSLSAPEAAEEDSAPQTQKETQAAPARPRRVYMIRCQDDKLNRPLEECLSKWGIAITPIPGDYSEAALDELLRQDPQIGFAVVPLSRDEFHYAKDAKPATALLQSSPDVIFKLGFLCGRLGKTNCFVLYQEQKSYTLPTALINVLFTVMDPHRHWQDILRDRLRHAGLAPVEGSA